MGEKVIMMVDKKGFNSLNGQMYNRLPRTDYNYGKDVGDGLGSAIVVATGMWVARQFPEAALAVADENGDFNHRHPLVQLFAPPNKWYGRITMFMALSMDYTIQGNAYLWIEPRGVGNIPAGLIWIPSASIMPKGTKNELVTHYEYYVDSGTIEIPRENIIHFRNGIDPRNQSVGLAPIQSLLREVFTDDEAANFTAAVLRNMGYPGLMISPADEHGDIGPRVRNRIKKYFNRVFSKDKRGDVLVTSGRLKVDTLKVNLAELGLSKLRQIPEERITAVMGIPAAVVGLGTGIEQTKVGITLEQMRAQAYNNVIIPMQHAFAEEIGNRLLPEYETEPENYRVIFDNSNVLILQEDKNNTATRLVSLYQGGLITRAEGRTKMGYTADEQDNVYLTKGKDVFVPRIVK